jgi:hypothetical protein
MLKLLLDEHISQALAQGLRRHKPDVAVQSLAEWEQGAFLGQPDSLLLVAAGQQRLTLVTYDLRTIPVILKAWAEEGRFHAGVIFVDQRTIAQNNIGALVRAIILLIEEASRWDWTNRIHFLRR